MICKKSKILSVVVFASLCVSAKSFAMFSGRPSDMISQSEEMAKKMSALIEKKKQEKLEQKQVNEDVCSICLESLKNTKENGKVVRLSCKGKHKFHGRCMNKWVSEGNSETCPLCREVIKKPKNLQ